MVRRAVIGLLWVGAILVGCSRIEPSLGGRPCDGGVCPGGLTCHPERQTCVPPITSFACDGSGLCIEDVDVGTPCDSPGAFFGCGADPGSCADGCRTCDEGQWGPCSGCEPSNGGVEQCDGLDNDCDGTSDEANTAGCTERHRDEDGDGFGTIESRCLCAPTTPYTSSSADDCDDTPSLCGAACHPGGTELCDGFDNDCDLIGDDDVSGEASDCTPWYLDGDGDGLGAGVAHCACGPSGSYDTATGGDCDDGTAACGADCTTDADDDTLIDCLDTCIDADDDNTCAESDCDDTDEDNWVSCQTCVDGDGDGAFTGCDAYVVRPGPDCDDVPTACGVACGPLGSETCDGLDNDCSGTADDNLEPAPPCPLQPGVCSGSTPTSCAGSVGWVTCDDQVYANHATATFGVPYEPGNVPAEANCDGHDNDCDEIIDEGCAFHATNLPSVSLCDAGVTTDLVINANLQFDTANLQVGGAEPDPAPLVVTQAGAPDIAVFRYRSVTINTGVAVTAVGARVLAIIACETITVAGSINLCANGRNGRVGGYDGGVAGQAGHPNNSGGAGGGYVSTASSTRFVGGGGGANCAAGGDGGRAGPLGSRSAGGAGGTAHGNAELSPIRGGGGGGSGEDESPGGGGGGALILAAGESITVSGTILACGAGGASHNNATTGGGGGGAGGAILIESPQVTVTGAATIGAPGGGGAGGYISPGVSGGGASSAGGAGQGIDWQDNGGSAAGDPGGGGGGKGAPRLEWVVIVLLPFYEGAAGGSSDTSGGGGGGSSGRIRINTRDGLSINGNSTLGPDQGSACFSTGGLNL